VAQDLDEQPAGVAARAERQLQGLLGRLHAGLQPDRVADRPLQLLVEPHQEVDRVLPPAVDAGEVLLQSRAWPFCLQIGRELLLQGLRVGEGPLVGVLLDEEVEGVDHRHVGDHLDVHQQFAGPLGEYQARQVVAEGVLLPVLMKCCSGRTFIV